MNVKQVIVIRKDLNMRKGKMCAQAAHASMKVFFDRILVDAGRRNTSITIPLQGDAEAAWIFGLFTKVVVGCDSEAALLDLETKAKAAGLPCALIQDSGATEFGGVPTYTALAVGPASSDVIDPITGALPLL